MTFDKGINLNEILGAPLTFDATNPVPFNDHGAALPHSVYLTNWVVGTKTYLCYNRQYRFLGTIDDEGMMKLKENGAEEVQVWENYEDHQGGHGYGQWWNLKQVAIPQVNIRSRDGEYRVPGPDATEAQAYYTSDRADAIGTARKVFGATAIIRVNGRLVR